MMLETARNVGKLKPDALKIQLLHVIKNTPLEEMYKNDMLNVMSKENYISTVVNQLEYIPPQTVIERITGDGNKDKLMHLMEYRQNFSSRRN